MRYEQPYHAGELTEQVTILEAADIPDSGGGRQPGWETVDVVRALVRPLRGRERERNQQPTANAMYLVVIRNRPDISERNTLEWRGRRLNIKHAPPRPGGEFLEMEAELGGGVK